MPRGSGSLTSESHREAGANAPTQRLRDLLPRNVKPFCWEEEREMKMLNLRKSTGAAVIAAVVGLSACTSDQVIDNTVGVAAGGTKIVAKGVVGAGKLVYRGVAGSDEE